jgi:deferrochelatase/peroxidase EfeB
MSAQVSRRGLLGALGGGAVAAGLLGGGVATARAAVAGGAADAVVPFHGGHQAGIATSVQSNLHFAAFDVTATTREALAGLLQDWTAAAADLCAGREVGEGGAVAGAPLAPPDDTGEALGLPAARLTLTLGLGPSLFDDRFGLAERRPAALAPLPAFPGDALDPARSDGDLCVQACADDPQVAVHAIRTLNRLAAGRAAVRWAQLGFGKAASTDPDQPTPRNLFGFKDGTANPAGSDAPTLQRHVWVARGDDPAAAWMAGGSYLVVRRVAMLVETWDRTSLTEQEVLVGRTKGEGAPLGHGAGAREHDAVEVAALPATSHVRLAHPSRHGGATMLRRGYNYVEGSDGLGHLDAGLFFISYQRDPAAFVSVQSALARDDTMNEYLRHTGSGLWAVPPGVAEGGWWAQGLLA